MLWTDAYGNLLGVLAACVLFDFEGIYILTLFVAVYILANKGIQGRWQIVYWACMIVLLICNTLGLANKIDVIFVNLRAPFIPSHDLDAITDATVIGLTMNKFIRISSFGMNVNLANYLLAVLMAGSIGSNVADIAINTLEDALDRSIVMDCVFSAFSLAVNLLATSLMALTACNCLIDFYGRRHCLSKRRSLFKDCLRVGSNLEHPMGIPGHADNDNHHFNDNQCRNGTSSEALAALRGVESSGSLFGCPLGPIASG
ncbi:hypothetical protein GYMLUDRAFT_52572 [Collybiopsis luxurians FD-317 M1]|nr:hypothetical protein GYMLUDRAFT_52572 [Collybiopsis luxurians FD-317 M1]